MKILYAFPLIFTIFLSCSSDESGIDSSSITNFRWQLSTFKTSVPIDLNRDGIAHTDMITELSCIGDEFFYFNQQKKTFEFAPIIYTVQVNPDHSIKEYSCNEATVTGPAFYGNYKMLNKNSIQLRFKGSYLSQNFTQHSTNYQFTGEKLVQTGEQSYPTFYNETTTSWTNSTITVIKEYHRVPFH